MKDKTKDGKEFYNLWFVLEGKGSNRGSVLDSYCVCLGGSDGSCKHVGASLYYSLDDLLNSKGEDSITSKPCQWILRPKPDTTPCELQDLGVKERDLKIVMNQRERGVELIHFPNTLTMTHAPFRTEHHVHKNS